LVYREKNRIFVENIDMDINIVESLLKSSLRSKWTIKGKHLCFTDSYMNFLFDKIEDSLFGFRKLILVSDGRLIEMSLLEKMKLAPLVRAKKNEVISRLKSEAIVKSMEERHRTPPLPTPPKPRLEGLTKTKREALVSKWETFDSLGGLPKTMTSERLGSLLGGRPSRPSAKPEGLFEGVNKAIKESKNTLSEAEMKTKKFKEDVEIEKLRIRELLRKDK
jgi:hypothetical protein